MVVASHVRLAAALAVLPAVLGAAAPTVVTEPAHAAFRWRDPRIAESSGLAAASRESGVWFTHNDSGDVARFFAVGPTGLTLATYRLGGATAVDCEDMAVAPAADGTPTVWLADIGDNDQQRSSITVHAAREPLVDRAATGRELIVRATAYRLRYPDGPHDAETLLADPVRHRLYVVTKTFAGTSAAYVAPAQLSASGTATLARVALLRWPLTGTRGGPVGPLGSLAATGGSVAPDGRALVIRTYTDAYFWAVGAGGIAAALRRPPDARVALPAQPQGEGIAFARDGRSVLVGSEGAGTTVYRLAVPALRAPVTAPPSRSATPAPSAAPSPASASGGRPPSRAPLWWAAGAAVTGALVVGGARLAVRRARPGRRRP
ncbi:MAG: hypothetical protein ACJ74O_18625 [Frankiaceae bacterium]